MSIPTFKVIVIGDTNTGKTSIIHQYTRQNFPEAHFTTPLPIEHSKSVNGNCNLDIWDTAGAEEWQSMNTSVYHGSDAIIYLCAYDNQESLTNLKEVWQPMVNKYIGADSVLSFLAVNKSDLSEEQKNITQENIDQTKDDIKAISSFIVSAKRNTNVSELFEEVAAKLTIKASKNAPKTVTVDDTPKQESEKKGCC